MAADRVRHVLLYGLEVTDAARYQRYRELMTPIVRRYGGDFGYDFVVGELLKSETEAPINRVFTIVFREAADADRFFSDPSYRQVRAEFFEAAVGHITKIAAFDERLPG